MFTMVLILLPAAGITALGLEAATESGPLEKCDFKLSTLLCGKAPLGETPVGCSMKVFFYNKPLSRMLALLTHFSRGHAQMFGV